MHMSIIVHNSMSMAFTRALSGHGRCTRQAGSRASSSTRLGRTVRGSRTTDRSEKSGLASAAADGAWHCCGQPPRPSLREDPCGRSQMKAMVSVPSRIQPASSTSWGWSLTAGRNCTPCSSSTGMTTVPASTPRSSPGPPTMIADSSASVSAYCHADGDQLPMKSDQQRQRTGLPTCCPRPGPAGGARRCSGLPRRPRSRRHASRAAPGRAGRR